MSFVKKKFSPDIPSPANSEILPAKTTSASERLTAEALARISERQQKKMATAATLVAAQDLLDASHSDLALRLVLRVTGSNARTYHVRVVDMLNAKSGKVRDVALCDATGERISTADPVQRSSMPLAVVLAGSVELLPVSNSVTDPNSVVGTTMSDDESVKHFSLADEDRRLLEAEIEDASMDDHSVQPPQA